MAGKTVSDQLRKAIRDYGAPSYRAFGAECGVDPSQISRFMRHSKPNDGRGITDETFSVICEFLKLELRTRDEKTPPRKKV